MNEFGELLRQARDFKGVTLRDAERATRIRRNYLAALEAQEFSQLPAPAYARGIVRNYSQYLGLDPVSTLALYEAATGNANPASEVINRIQPMDTRSHWAPNFAVIAFMLVMAGVVFAWMYSAYFQESASVATTTVGIATVTPVPDSILAMTSREATVATQGGGEATITPTQRTASTPTATTLPETPPVVAAPTETTAVVVVQPEPTTEPVTETAVDSADVESVDESSVEEPAPDEEDVPGAYTFVVWAIEEIWVQMIVDGDVVYDDVLPAGGELVYDGDTLAVTSGNAAVVEVYVDGEAYSLGDTWDATFYFP